MRVVKALLCFLAACTPAAMSMTADHPASPTAPSGRLAAAPAALAPGVADPVPVPPLPPVELKPPPVETAKPVDKTPPATKRPVTKPKPAPKPTPPAEPDHSQHHH
jgi:hypothetical protein